VEIADRIHAGLLAYAAGDAFGVPWEGRPPAEVAVDRLAEVPARHGWPRGATSDDTALTRLVAEHLADAGGVGDPLDLLRRLAAEAATIPGLGPSTRRAVAHFAATGRPDGSGLNTNGAPMRALPVGWAVPAGADDRRRDWTLALTRVTHNGADALAAACVMSACASRSLAGAGPDELAAVAAAEAAVVGPGTAVARATAAVLRGAWEPPAAGIGLAPDETVAAVLRCCLAAGGDLSRGLVAAVRLGGDTDTVAALVGGLLGVALSPAEVAARLPWSGRVTLPPEPELARLARELALIRGAGGG